MKQTVKNILRWIWYHRLPVPIPWRTANGCWMLLYRDEMGLGLTRPYEKPIVQFVREFVRRGMVCVDVGANQGFYTLLFSKLVGSQGKVIAFEPVIGETVRLMRNFKLNRRLGEVGSAPNVQYLFNNVILKVAAVGADLRSREIFVTAQHESRSSIVPILARTDLSSFAMHVAGTTLDHFVSSKVDLLKIDVEGAELEVLAGAKRILTEDRPVVIIEVADVATRNFGYEAGKILDVLENYRYRVVAADKGEMSEDGSYGGTFALLPHS